MILIQALLLLVGLFGVYGLTGVFLCRVGGACSQSGSAAPTPEYQTSIDFAAAPLTTSELPSKGTKRGRTKKQDPQHLQLIAAELQKRRQLAIATVQEILANQARIPLLYIKNWFTRCYPTDDDFIYKIPSCRAHEYPAAQTLVLELTLQLRETEDMMRSVGPTKHTAATLKLLRLRERITEHQGAVATIKTLADDVGDWHRYERHMSAERMYHTFRPERRRFTDEHRTLWHRLEAEAKDEYTKQLQALQQLEQQFADLVSPQLKTVGVAPTTPSNGVIQGAQPSKVCNGGRRGKHCNCMSRGC